MERYARRYKRPHTGLSPELQARFLSYEWPGNIRELENMVKRIVILQDEQVAFRELNRVLKPALAAAAADLDADIDIESGDDEQLDEHSAQPLSNRLADIARDAARRAERPIIEKTLSHVQWNRRRAAAELGVSYKTLLSKMKTCGISQP
jgi:two-component system response regulator AtoC